MPLKTSSSVLMTCSLVQAVLTFLWRVMNRTVLNILHLCIENVWRATMGIWGHITIVHEGMDFTRNHTLVSSKVLHCTDEANLQLHGHYYSTRMAE